MQSIPAGGYRQSVCGRSPEALGMPGFGPGRRPGGCHHKPVEPHGPYWTFMVTVILSSVGTMAVTSYAVRMVWLWLS
jgi:hypothetical protein